MATTVAPIRTERRWAAAAALAGGAIGMVSNLLFLAAFGWDVAQASAAPDLGVAVTAERAGLFRWACLADMVGYYLLTIPVVVYLGRRLDWQGDFPVAVATVCGLAYALIGAMGAVMLAAAAPPLIAADTQQSAALLDLLRGIVFVGLWQTLETLPWSVWLLVVGLRLRPRQPVLGGVALALGVGALLMAVGRLLQIEALVFVAATLVLGPFALWMLAVGMAVRSGRL